MISYRVTTARSLPQTVGNLSPTIEVACRGPAVLADATLPGKPLCATRAGPPAGCRWAGCASRQLAGVASRRGRASRRGSTSYRGSVCKRVQLRPETRGEIRAANRRRGRNRGHDRCGGTEYCYGKAGSPHRILHSWLMREIIRHDLAENDNGADEEGAVGWAKRAQRACPRGLDSTKTGGGVGVVVCSLDRSTPTPAAFAPLRRPTLPKSSIRRERSPRRIGRIWGRVSFIATSLVYNC
jgi:hypothetical protein